MHDDRKKRADDTIDADRFSYARRTGRPPRFTGRLFVHGLFAAGVALSFTAAASVFRELVTRPAVPASMLPLYAPIAGCVAFAVGLILSLLKNRHERVWDFRLSICIAIGASTTAFGVVCPQTWR